MINLLNRGILSALLVAAALAAGCGGRTDNAASGGGGTDPSAGAPGDIAASVPALLAFINGLFSNSENSEPVDINAISLAVDDTAEPAPVAF